MSPERKTVQFRDALSSWQFWMGVAYFGMILVVVALYFQNGRILAAQRNADRTQTIRVAEIRSNATSQYLGCVASIPTLRRVNRFVAGVQQLHRVLLENASATHAVEPPGTDLYAAQAQNIVRLERTVRLVSGVHFPVPTIASCVALRARILSTIG